LGWWAIGTFKHSPLNIHGSMKVLGARWNT
jgi:hypothetical protein